MRTQLSADPLLHDQEQALRRLCRVFKDDLDVWHMWLIDADDPVAIRCVEWVLDLTVCPKAMKEAACQGIELRILTNAIVGAIGSICHLRADHTFSDRECAGMFLDNVEQNS
jgi:hypothetical protein